MKRKATAVWNGNIKDGKGHLTTDSTVLPMALAPTQKSCWLLHTQAALP